MRALLSCEDSGKALLNWQYLKTKLKHFIIHHFFSYDSRNLSTVLWRLGVRNGDVLMVHASWWPQNGFRGDPADLIRALQDLVGFDGLLIMPSFTYQNESSKQFLSRCEPMDVRRSPSQMGLACRVVRRRS